MRDNGAGWEKFRQMVSAQGGDLRQIDDPTLLPQAQYRHTVTAPQTGVIAGIQTGKIGWATVDLGAGRRKKSDKLDYAVGLIMPAKIGDKLTKGDPIATIYANDETKIPTAEQQILQAIEWSDKQLPALPHFYGLIENRASSQK